MKQYWVKYKKRHDSNELESMALEIEVGIDAYETFERIKRYIRDRTYDSVEIDSIYLLN